MRNYKALNPSGLFPPSACHESGWARYKKELQRGKTEKNWSFNIFLLSDPIPPFLCINSFNNLAKANPETRKPFPNQCHKNPCHLLRNIMMRMVFICYLFFSFFFLFIWYHLVPHFLNSCSEKTNLHFKTNKKLGSAYGIEVYTVGAVKKDRRITIIKISEITLTHNVFTMKQTTVTSTLSVCKQNRWGISHCWFLSSKDGYFQFINSQLSSLIYLSSRFLLGSQGWELGRCGTSLACCALPPLPATLFVAGVRASLLTPISSLRQCLTFCASWLRSSMVRAVWRRGTSLVWRWASSFNSGRGERATRDNETPPAFNLVPKQWLYLKIWRHRCVEIL